MGLFSFFNKKKYKEAQPSIVRSPYTMSGGTAVTPDTSMKVSAFYSGVTYISTQIAKLPWHVKDANNKKLNNSISQMLNLKPNSEMNSMMFKLFLMQSTIIHGNGFAEIERDSLGRIVALWPIPATDVQVTRWEGELLYRIIGGSLSYQGEDAFLKPEDVYHIRNFYTVDGIYGQGVVAYGSETLGISLGADRFANSLFSNGGMPSGVLEVEGQLSPEAQKRLIEGWRSAYGGRKVGGTAVLEDGVKYNSISHDPQVLQFLESRKFSVLEIARFLRVPPTKLFDSETSTYNNIEHENLAVATDTLDAWARMLEIEADVKLLSNGFAGRKTEMDISAIFRGDMNTRSQYFSRMMQNGAITPNEIRESEGREPYAEGDEFYIATNNFTPVSRMNEVIDAQLKNSSQKQEPAKEAAKEDESEKELNNAITDYIRSKNLA